jgi:hypothetical protein
MTGELAQHLSVEKRARRHTVKQQDRITFALFADENVMVIHDDALACRFVLFDQPGLSHTGTASPVELAEA